MVIVGVLYWGVSSLLSKSFSGRGLTFEVGHGTVALTNPTDEGVTAQLVSPGTRSFTVATNLEDVSGSSERIGTVASTFYMPSAGAGAFVVWLLVHDLSLYLAHLAMHKVPGLWALHRLHHAATEMNIVTGTRISLGEHGFNELVVLLPRI